MGIYKRKKIIERIVLIGPITKAGKWMVWCYENGYEIVRSGPKPTHGRYCDSTKFKIIVEKEIK